jgi:Acyl-CoA synthetases (AMP-forming)/AMP-acid ligases II
LVGKLNLTCIRPSATPLSDIPDKGVDLASFTPMQFFSITQNKAHLRIAENIHTILLGGSEVNPVILRQTANMRNHVYATYGMTETLSHVALKKISPPLQTAFFPLPGVDIETDADSALIITAPFLGVQSLPTNDIVKLYHNKSFEWLGRRDNIINSGGIKIVPEVAEEKLHDILTIPFFIAGLPDEKLGHQLILVLEKKDITQQESNELQLLISGKLGAGIKPGKIIALPKFIRTDTGKIMRKETLKSAGLLP